MRDDDAPIDTQAAASANPNDNFLFQWIVWGNVIVPTGDPFVVGVEEETGSSPSTRPLWGVTQLGPGLQLLRDHIVAVDFETGRIRHLEPATARITDERVLATAAALHTTATASATSTGSATMTWHQVLAEALSTIVDDDNDENDDTRNKNCGAGSCLRLVRNHTKIIRLDPRTEFLCPGMIDLHIHAPQYSYSGTATDRPLLGRDGWLETYTFPAEARLFLGSSTTSSSTTSHDDIIDHDDASLPRNGSDDASEIYTAVVSTTLRHGTTTALYFGTLHLEPTKVLVDTALKLGQRALVGKVCMDRNAPTYYCQSLEENVSETQALIEYIHGRVGQRKRVRKLSLGGPSSSAAEDNSSNNDNTHNSNNIRPCLPLILPVVTPRFIPTCTPALLTELGKLAARYDCHITTHISESLDQVAFTRELDRHDQQQQQLLQPESLDDTSDGSTTQHVQSNIAAGRTDATILNEHGLLTDQCVLAHGVHLTAEDGRLLQRQRCAVAHCPLSNFFFAGNVFPCRHWMQHGLKIGLGTDIAGGYHPSIFHSARMTVVASLALQQQQQQQQKAPVYGEENDDVVTKEKSSGDYHDDDMTNATEPAAKSQQQQQHALDYRHAFYLATLGGARALGLQDSIGTLAVGMEFDAIVLSAADNTTLNQSFSPVGVFSSDTVTDIFQKLCVLGDDRNVKQVFVQGVDVTIRTS